MRVLKRDGTLEPVKFDKITTRINTLKAFKTPYSCVDVDPHLITQKVCETLFDGVSTQELDRHAAHVAGNMIIQNEDYGNLGARLLINNLLKEIGDISFQDSCKRMVYLNILDPEILKIVQENENEINDAFNYKQEYYYDYFGAQTLLHTYLIQHNGKNIERPAHMWMRVALGIHKWDVPAAIETYDMMSSKLFTHATPTLFSSGTRRPQMSSCFLLTTEDDSIDGMYNTVKDCAVISKYAGGVGLSVTNIRSKGSEIAGTNGTSDGIIPWLRVVNNTAKHVNQAGRRAGAFAIYIEPMAW